MKAAFSTFNLITDDYKIPQSECEYLATNKQEDTNFNQQKPVKQFSFFTDMVSTGFFI